MTTYYTTLNSGLKFIDNFVTDNEWTPCEYDDVTKSYTFTVESVTYVLQNIKAATPGNENSFSLKKGDDYIQITELPPNLRVNMAEESGSRTFVLEKKTLETTIQNSNATLGFDPKYFVYDSTNECYTINSEAIILDHDVAACAGIIAVSVFEVNETGTIDTTKPSNYIKAEIDTSKRQLNIGVSNITTSIIDSAVTNITSSNDFITVHKTDSHTFNISFDNTKVHTYTATSGYYINVSAETEGVNDNFTISLNANVNKGTTYTVGTNDLDTFIAVSAKTETVALPKQINVSDTDTRIVNDGGNLNVYVASGKLINFYVNDKIVMSIGENTA